MLSTIDNDELKFIFSNQPQEQHTQKDMLSTLYLNVPEILIFVIQNTLYNNTFYF